jgi:hypothetical protein
MIADRLLGIGLTLVRRLIEMHGGEVAVESRGVGHGSQFTIRLPALATPARPLPLQEEALPVARSASRRVLVVDDNVDAANSIAKLLELLGHRVRCVYDGLPLCRLPMTSGPRLSCWTSDFPEWMAMRSPGGCGIVETSRASR